MNALNIKLSTKEAAIIGDALMDAAIALRTNHMTDVVMSEEKFLNSDISTARRERYLALTSRANELRDFVRLS